MKNKKSIAFFSLAFAGMTALMAQVSVNASGGNVTGSGGSVSFSVGQSFYTAVSGAGGNIVMGVQQPYEIYVNGVELPNKPIAISVFPNPTAHMLQVQFTELNPWPASYQLIDAQGRVVQKDNLSGQSDHVSMANLPSGNYFLQVIRNNKEIQSFSIIKN
jgi:hypothetical protein